MQIADELSIQLLAFNFGGRTTAFKWFAQGLIRSSTAFSACVKKNIFILQAIDVLFISMIKDQEQSMEMHFLKTWNKLLLKKKAWDSNSQ